MTAFARIRVRPLYPALAFGLLASTAQAEDLLQAYAMARDNDMTFAQAESSVLAAREGPTQARALMLPQLTARLDFKRARDTAHLPNYTRSDSTTRGTSASLTQSILNFGNISRSRGEKALAEAARFSFQSAGHSLMQRTAAAYFTVLVQLETLTAAETSVKATKRQFEYADKRLEVGLAPITDVHEAKAQYERARASLIDARNAVKRAERDLARITGQHLHAYRGLPADFRPNVTDLASLSQYLSGASATNPDVNAIRSQLDAAESDVSTARAGHLPTIDLEAGYTDTSGWGSRKGAISAEELATLGYGPSIGLSLNVPLFQGGAVQSQVRQALANRDNTAEQLELAQRSALDSIHDYYEAVTAGVSEVDALREAVVSAQAAYDASTIGLEVGTRTVLDVLVNQQNLVQAQVDYAQGKYTFLNNRIALEAQAGTLTPGLLADINRMLTVPVSTRIGGTGS